MIFRNRKHAGELLAQMLQKYKEKNAVVLALPRGGVPVAAEVAKYLEAPLDVLIVRKIGAPYQPELAVGAICEDGEPIWNDSTLYRLGLEPDDLGAIVGIEREKVKKQIQLFRQSKNLSSIALKTVIIIDDGLATGATMLAAIKYVKKISAVKVVVALPVAAKNSATKLRSKVSEVVIVNETQDLFSVGQWYEDFSQVTNAEVVSLLKKYNKISVKDATEIEFSIGRTQLKGDLKKFPTMKALIIFAHGSGSSRKSPRNQQVAQYLQERGFGTFLFDLLTNEESIEKGSRFNIELLSERLASTAKWLRAHFEFNGVPFGFFGASTGAAAAIQAASKLSEKDSIYAIVSRGGRPDLAGDSLKAVKVPTLLLVGSLDFNVLEINQQSQRQMHLCKVSVIPGATHLFEERGALEEVSKQAADWFQMHLMVEKNQVDIRP